MRNHVRGVEIPAARRAGPHGTRYLFAAGLLGGMVAAAPAAEPSPAVAASTPAVWRAERRIVDMHLHVEPLPERIDLFFIEFQLGRFFQACADGGDQVLVFNRLG